MARSLAGVFFVADFAGVMPGCGGGADVVLVARIANPCRLTSNPTALVLVTDVAAAVVEDPFGAPLLFVFPLGAMPSMAFRADAGVAIRPMRGRRRGSSRPNLEGIYCCCCCF